MSDEDETVLSKMIGFIYTSDYDPGDLSPLLLHAALYAVAVKYQMPALQALTKRRFQDDLRFGEKAQIPNAAVVPAVYDRTAENDRGLRDLLIHYFSRDLKALLEDKDFQQVLKDNPDFAIDLLRYHKRDDDQMEAANAGRSGVISICRFCAAAEKKFAAGNPIEYVSLISQHMTDSNEFRKQMNAGIATYQKPIEYRNHLRVMHSLTIKHEDFSKIR